MLAKVRLWTVNDDCRERANWHTWVKAEYKF